MDYPFQIKNREAYDTAYTQSMTNPESFWAEIASHFYWREPWSSVLEWNFTGPEIAWFKGGHLNITENCLDRHLEENGNSIALKWEPNDPQESNRVLTYTQLYERVCVFANTLKNQGVKKGDRVIIYMGMVPELTIALLACARIGAIHSVIFGGFSAQSIADRITDCGATFVITCDGAHRGNKLIGLKAIIDEALAMSNGIKKVIVLKHTHETVYMRAGRDTWWHDAEKNMAVSCPAEEMDAEDILFILYTSGSTGKPKGVVHTCGGYMVWTTYTFLNIFQYNKGEVFFCTADIGWITGHSYIVYGPLCAGATSLMFEGIPTYPNAGRFWEIIEKHQVNILYTAPTAIRSLMNFGSVPFENKDLSSLRVLGTVGEPINEEAWHWYDEFAGHKNCPIVDTWWQTETGGIMISNLAAVTPSRPGWATLPQPGVFPALMDEAGREITVGEASGNLCIKAPWPGMLRTTYGDHERCRQNYFTAYPGYYFTGDGATRDAEGNYRITGRVDDVLNVSGHRIGTAEVENAINMFEGVIESAVVGYTHDIKGQGIYAFVIFHEPPEETSAIKKGITDMVAKIIGPLAKPEKIQLVTGLPKTRSGKIMRRILRKIAEGDMANMGDMSTLLDPAVVEEISQNRE
ncbi:MAG: acetate--CoA ligase [Ferruginibacter sp.]